MVVRSSPTRHRLTFLLPRGLTVDSVPPAFDDGCAMAIAGSSSVAIEGPSREAVFDRAATVLRAIGATTGPAAAISAMLETPSRCHLGRGGRDGWNIIVGTDVAFSPTTIDAHFPRPTITLDAPELAAQ